MSGQSYAAMMFPFLFFLVFLGFPVSFALIATAFLFGLPIFGNLVGLQLFGIVLNSASQFVLSSVPPFILMGYLLERSGIAERLFNALQMWLGGLPGGLALATMTMAAIFAASTGIVGAVEVVIGLMAIPVMLRVGYSRALISGTICAGGSLGTMIPPSITVVVYASVANMSVGKLLAGVLLPGLLMVALFLGYIFVRCLLRPSDGPPSRGEAKPLGEKLKVTASALLPAAGLIMAVLGSIMFGIASPTEAASVGALATLLLTIAYRRFSWPMLLDALKSTVLINAMILFIVLGGSMFSAVFRVHGGNDLVLQLVREFNLSTTVIILVFLLIVFLAGFVLDWVSIVLICLPVFLPILTANKVDQIWCAVLMLIVIQTSYLTPPMAPSIFYLRGIAPPEITYRDMYRGVVPFIICQVIIVLLVVWFPGLATYLASRVLASF